MVQWYNDTIVFLGGYTGGNGQKGTYFFKGGDTWDKGPNMNYNRLVSACGIKQVQNMMTGKLL
jgi:hypothetical protein